MGQVQYPEICKRGLDHDASVSIRRWGQQRAHLSKRAGAKGKAPIWARI